MYSNKCIYYFRKVLLFLCVAKGYIFNVLILNIHTFLPPKQIFYSIINNNLSILEKIISAHSNLTHFAQVWSMNRYSQFLRKCYLINRIKKSEFIILYSKRDRIFVIFNLYINNKNTYVTSKIIYMKSHNAT